MNETAMIPSERFNPPYRAYGDEPFTQLTIWNVDAKHIGVLANNKRIHGICVPVYALDQVLSSGLPVSGPPAVDWLIEHGQEDVAALLKDFYDG